MANTERILVTGATGKVGSALLDNLTSAGLKVRALVRDESRVRVLTERNVEVVPGDFLEPETLGPALEGVSAVFLLTPIHPQQVHQAANVIEAARESGNDPCVVRLAVHQASHEAQPGSAASTPRSKTGWCRQVYLTPSSGLSRSCRTP